MAEVTLHLEAWPRVSHANSESHCKMNKIQLPLKISPLPPITHICTHPKFNAGGDFVFYSFHKRFYFINQL